MIKKGISHVKQEANKLRVLLYLLSAIPFFALGQANTNSIVGKYSHSDEYNNYQIELKKDLTFIYHHSFKSGTTRTTGKWNLRNDTLILSDFNKPEVVTKVEELVVDTLNDNSELIVILDDKNPVPVRGGSHTIMFDKQPITVKFDSKTHQSFVTGFAIWVNDKSNKTQFTDSLGKIKFTKKNLKTISFAYDNYSIKNPKSNYFILTLSNYPASSYSLLNCWRKWIFSEGTLSPIDCNTQSDLIILKK